MVEVVKWTVVVRVDVVLVVLVFVLVVVVVVLVVLVMLVVVVLDRSCWLSFLSCWKTSCW